MISTNISLKGDANLTEFMQDYSQVVPEPFTASLVVTALAGLLGFGWRRRHYRR
jgi:hypothetical protein